jgi:hypothetical protein
VRTIAPVWLESAVMAAGVTDLLASGIATGAA